MSPHSSERLFPQELLQPISVAVPSMKEEEAEGEEYQDDAHQGQEDQDPAESADNVDDVHVDDDDDEPFHELYLLPQTSGMEFLVPILFEDGMDSVECELYYAAHQGSSGAAKAPTNASPTSVVPLRRPLKESFSSSAAAEAQELPSILRSRGRRGSLEATAFRRTFSPAAATTAAPAGPADSTPPLTTARTSTTCTTASTTTRKPKKRRHCSDPVAVRRCSFSGIGSLRATLFRPVASMSRSRSHDELEMIGVSFQEYVQVVTIPTVLDYPDEVRSSIWMSQQEMRESMKQASQESNLPTSY
jgi:hypothetical protein